MIGAGVGEQYSQPDGGKHEDDRGIGSHLGQEAGCATRTKRRLGTLTAKGSGQIGGLALLQEDDTNDEKGDDDVKDCDEIEHLCT